MKITIEKAKNGQFYFNIKAANHKVLATSETYINRSDCKSAAESIANAKEIAVVDMTAAAS
ncbi:MAG: YegP family protein [Candidatus Methylacidiphilales bacterium]|nr:YegP family protein [Candidatus Methylacidiphilales bacterium]